MRFVGRGLLSTLGPTPVLIEYFIDVEAKWPFGISVYKTE